MWLNGVWIETYDMKRALYAEPGEGEGAGGTGEGTGEKAGSGESTPPDLNKQFSDFSATITNQLKGFQREMTALKKAGESTKALEAQLKEIHTKLTAGEKGVADADTEDGSTEGEVIADLTKKDVDPAVAEMKKELARLKAANTKHEAALTAEQQRREAAELRQRQGERDRQLAEALTEVKAVNVRDAAKFLRSDVEWDEEAGSWYFLDGEDRLSITDGVEKFLPKYMREPASKRGGSGGQGTGMENTSTKQQLQQAAIDAGVLAKKMGGRDEFAIVFQRAKKAAVDAGVDPQVITRAVLAAPAA